MTLVAHVWNTIAVMDTDKGKLSRRSILENTDRKYDLSDLRAFGTKCHWMRTVAKKGGRKRAMHPKAFPGVILGIEHDMPAYRVLDLSDEKKGAMQVPFAQVITHEGVFPFKHKNL